MKELKKISLKEEIDREARQIDKEVRERKDLDDITVSEKMETSLFNKIQDYEYDRRSKTVHRKKKKRYVVLALAAVLVLVFGSVMTSMGSKSYWKVLWDRIAGEENAQFINVEEMDVHETQDLDEVHIYKEIWNELGITAVGWGYFPENTFLKDYEIDKDQTKATFIYECNGEIIRYVMYMNDEDSSLGQIKTDRLISEYKVETGEGISVSVKEYDIEDMEENRYAAEFEYDDAQYQIMGIIDEEEFTKIIENLIFL
mgnify:FL=1